MSQVHAQARTTPRTRAEIKASSASLAELAERFNITRATAAKWKGRETPHDLSHPPAQAQHDVGARRRGYCRGVAAHALAAAG